MTQENNTETVKIEIKQNTLTKVVATIENEEISSADVEYKTVDLASIK